MPGYTMEKEQFRARLRRIEGQVRGIERMIETDTYCIDVLTQIASVTKALQGVGLGLLDDHLRHCVHDAAAGQGDDYAAKIDEAVAAVARLLRS